MKSYQNALKNLVKQMQKTIYLSMDKDSSDTIISRLGSQSQLFFSSRISEAESLSPSDQL